jgi:ABC-type branched-subunit amino acid transport system substrate-binding protein
VQSAVRLGALGPLTLPGTVWAGKELLAGIELAVQTINAAGGVRGQPLELIIKDTKGNSAAGVDAISGLSEQGVHAVVGEFHSVVATAIAKQLGGEGFPIVFSSPTLDAITALRHGRVFRLTLPQSRGWRIYAAALAAQGVKHAIALIESSIYWGAGAQVLETRLQESGVGLTRIPWEPGPQTFERIRHLASSFAPAALLLLVNYPEPLASIMSELRSERRAGLVCCDPAGRAVLPDWWDVVGDDGIGVPFLAYQHPGELASAGHRMADAFARQHGRQPTFVALEGYDSVIAVLTAIEIARGAEPNNLCEALRHCAIQGTRGEIRFSTDPTGSVHQQWTWPPSTVVAFRKARDRFADAQSFSAPTQS